MKKEQSSKQRQYYESASRYKNFRVVPEDDARTSKMPERSEKHLKQ
jgi:hypothetical protein